MVAYCISISAHVFEAAYTPLPKVKGNAVTRDAAAELSMIIYSLVLGFVMAGIFVFAPPPPNPRLAMRGERALKSMQPKKGKSGRCGFDLYLWGGEVGMTSLTGQSSRNTGEHARTLSCLQ